MIHVQYMKPFYTKVTGSKLRLVFAHQYFSIMKDDEVFQYIPIEAKEIIVNINTMQVENLSDVFVFQLGNRFIRMPLYQLLLVSNIHDHLGPILDSFGKVEELNQHEELAEDMPDDIKQVIQEFEERNLKRLIDVALDQGNEKMFMELSNKLLAVN